MPPRERQLCNAGAVATLPCMSGARRHRLHRIARLVLVALLAIGIVAAPALSFAAEAHDAVAHAGDHDGDDGATHEHDDAPARDGDGRVLHAVMHLATCCGHACAMLPTAWQATFHVLPTQLAARVDAPAPEHAPERPLRPPIAA